MPQPDDLDAQVAAQSFFDDPGVAADAGVVRDDGPGSYVTKARRTRALRQKNNEKKEPVGQWEVNLCKAHDILDEAECNRFYELRRALNAPPAPPG
jgi:hypothetical protein